MSCLGKEGTLKIFYSLATSIGMIANTNVQSMVLGSSQLNTVVDLIYKLCCDPLHSGRNNLRTVIHWLEKCADEAVEVRFF